MSSQKSVAFYTLGCKLNFSESSSLSRQFENAGFVVLDHKEQADIYIINTCSVTEFADRKCRQIVRRFLRGNADAHIIIVGCYAQLKPQEIAEIPGVDLVLGAKEKFNILQYVEQLSYSPAKGLVHASEIQEVNSFESSFSFGDRTRSFLKIQDGCDYSCTFCTIPLARGTSRSATIAEVVAQAHEIAELGTKEIVLTGVNIGDFGKSIKQEDGFDRSEESFLDLIKELDKVEGIHRFRISSIEPNLCSDDVIEFVNNSDRFVHHFHMPLQSGNNKQLAQMRRRYRRELYEDRVALIRSLMPDAAIGVDVIVGFPGETDEDFEVTYDFLLHLDITYLHVFTYSERDDTLAIESEEVVPMHVRKERNKRLRILSEKKKRAFYEQFVGQEMAVLFEENREPGIMVGFTKNYLKVKSQEDSSLINSIETVILNELDYQTVFSAKVLVSN